MAGSMKDIKLRIKSVESTMQITKAMELVALVICMVLSTLLMRSLMSYWLWAAFTWASKAL